MTPYTYKITALILSGLFLFSCQSKVENTPAKTEGELIADPIIYEVIVKAPNEDDEWLNECLGNTKSSYLVKQVLKEVRAGNLNAYDYYDNRELSVREIEQIINDNDLNGRTGKIQFEENWYWDKEALKLRKEVRKIMFGFEIFDATGKLRGYKASFVIDLEK
ncbi:hypothetical protein [Marinifilum caeruleilacunae]|uniref:Lipoprotein n=1 Tax=Marinifilum caeruleilacunae TaxID=2499076 RepID=A0ABX1WVH6_9BACT|nr:hypothetical protein [Marinifilum caeruleilacunae]NOU60115.1 hypothetical protein [Marinifilum caeruleilacunae]